MIQQYSSIAIQHVPYQLLSHRGKTGIAPQLANELAACIDLALPQEIGVNPQRQYTCPLLIAFDIPPGYHIKLYPRSSLFTTYCILMPTSIIDAGYKDSIHVQLYNMRKYDMVTLREGQRIAQAMLVKNEAVCWEQVEQLDLNNDRGGGLGSTGV